ncbi:MAG: DNA primase [Candidatus Muiribacteriota bacterium]
MKIKKDYIDKLIDSISIIELIGDYVNLKKSGKNYSGLCPFHNEDTPSFFVDAQKKLFHCFGCKKSGNIIHFIEFKENYSFVEAVEFLSLKYNLPVEYEEGGGRDFNKYSHYYEVMKKACEIFRNNFLKNRQALNYLKSRKISKETIEKFYIGYSDGNLASYFAEKEKEYLVETGVLKKGEKGFYEVFSKRIIFPFFDIYQKVVGFAGRALKEDEKIKYLNSKNSILYDKSKFLYGLNIAKKEVPQKDFIIICEGYFDAMRLHDAGFFNTIATCGTKISPYQFKIIQTLTKNVILMYDSDSAGKEASFNIALQSAGKDLNLRVASLPENSDPDSYFVDKSGSDLMYIIKNSIFYADFVLEKYNKNIGDIYLRGKNFELASDFIQSIKNPVVKNKYMDKIEKIFGAKPQKKKFKKNFYSTPSKDPLKKKKEPEKLNIYVKKLLQIIISEKKALDLIFKKYYKRIDDLNLKNIIFNLYNRKSIAEIINMEIPESYKKVITDLEFNKNNKTELEEVESEIEHIFNLIKRDKILEKIKHVESLLNLEDNDDKLNEKLTNDYMKLIMEYKKMTEE